MKINSSIQPADLLPQVNQVLELACKKVRARFSPTRIPWTGTPVITVAGRYQDREWTNWTDGFHFGGPILCFDATDDRDMLELGRKWTVKHMSDHVTDMGVHDHGFNCISTFGNLRRLMLEGRIEHNEWELKFYEMALKASGAVQAARWSQTHDRFGYVYSFNGPHSLFVDTIRSMRSLVVAHQLGQSLNTDNNRTVGLLSRAVEHAITTWDYLVFKGDSGHQYDTRGRTAHEGLFNPKTYRFRSRATQQGYSPFSTWTRGLAWAILGFAELAECLATLSAESFDEGFIDLLNRREQGLYLMKEDQRRVRVRSAILEIMASAAKYTAHHYMSDVTALDGIPYWDDGAPGLSQLGDWRDRAAEPFNDHEPVDSSAAAIAAQGLIRLGTNLGKSKGKKYLSAGLTIAKTLFSEPYLSTSSKHEGLILHSIYHRPNGWDHIPRGRKIPCGESSMWGDYHAIELAVLIQRLARGDYMTFFDR